MTFSCDQEEFICTTGSVCDCTQTDESGISGSNKRRSQASQSEQLVIDDLEEEVNEGGAGTGWGTKRSIAKRSKTPSRATAQSRSLGRVKNSHCKGNSRENDTILREKLQQR